mgnify:CR=1 FL=1
MLRTSTGSTYNRMIKIGKVIGDVIEAGGVKNVTNNYYDGRQPQDEGKDLNLKSDTEVPEKLKTDEAEELMEDLVDEGLLSESWQPLNLSGTERALVAKAVCEHLHINEVWQVFGMLWGEKPETLRSYLNKALEQKKSLKFQDRLKNILG